jgi:iron complex outermembrane receptor protein
MARTLLVTLLTTTGLGAGLMATPAARAQQSAAFDIPPGPLAPALASFAGQSGLQISYDPAVAQDRRTAGLHGSATPAEGLARLLGGSDLSWQFLDANTVTISAAAATTAADPGEAGGIVLEPVLIYGDRTSRTLAGSRSSVVVIDAEAIENPTAPTIRATFNRMANVQGQDHADSGFSIRGISSEGFSLAGAPLASLYVDGVQQTRHSVRRGTRGIFDTEQVEVYRGPQSTLSGRAALAGAIYVRTKDPEFIRSGAAQLTYGEDAHRQFGLAFGDALSDRLAYRVSAEWSKKGTDLDYSGYEDHSLYDDLTTDEYYTLRGKLLWLPTGSDATRVIVSYAHSYDRPENRLIVGPGWSSSASELTYADRRAALYSAELSPYGVAIPAWTEVRDNKVDNLGIEITHRISDALTLTSQTGFTRSKMTRPGLNYGDSGDVNQSYGEQVQKILSQELRLNHDTDTLRWVAGVYLAKEQDDNWLNTSPHPLLGFASNLGSVTSRNLALFGEASWEFAPGWRLIAGGRADYNDRSYYQFSTSNGATTADNAGSTDETVFLPKLGLQYDFDSGHSVSLIYQHGYRPGGSGTRQSDGREYSFDPETARNIELAWRGTALEDRLNFSANLFWMRWQDQQVTLMTDPDNLLSRVTGNAAKSESWGAEVETSYAAGERLSLFASLGWLHSEFLDFNDVQWGDFSGLPFPGASNRSFALGLRWGDGTGWFASASAKYVSETLSRLEAGAGRPNTLPSRTVVDAEFGYDWNEVRMTAYASNLFDRQTILYESGDEALAAVGAAREIGLRLDYRF